MPLCLTAQGDLRAHELGPGRLAQVSERAHAVKGARLAVSVPNTAVHTDPRDPDGQGQPLHLTADPSQPGGLAGRLTVGFC
jgi:hypothetical protein